MIRGFHDGLDDGLQINGSGIIRDNDSGINNIYDDENENTNSLMYIPYYKRKTIILGISESVSSVSTQSSLLLQFATHFFFLSSFKKS